MGTPGHLPPHSPRPAPTSLLALIPWIQRNHQNTGQRHPDFKPEGVNLKESKVQAVRKVGKGIPQKKKQKKKKQILLARTDFNSKVLKGGHIMEGRSWSHLRCTSFEQFYLGSPLVEPSSQPHRWTSPLYGLGESQANLAGSPRLLVTAVVLQKEHNFFLGDLWLARGSSFIGAPGAWSLPSQSHHHTANFMTHQSEPKDVCRCALLALFMLSLSLMAPPFSCDPGWESGSWFWFLFFLPPLSPSRHKSWHLHSVIFLGFISFYSFPFHHDFRP